jgi:hypothetical protein
MSNADDGPAVDGFLALKYIIIYFGVVDLKFVISIFLSTIYIDNGLFSDISSKPDLKNTYGYYASVNN